MGKLLTENVREVLQAQYPNEDLVEIDGYIYHLPHTEEAWDALRRKVRPSWRVMKESHGLKHYIIYDPGQYDVCVGGDGYILSCREATTDIKIPINCSSCNRMFKSLRIPAGFKFSKTFDTSEVVDMKGMFYDATFMGDVSLGERFNTDKVEDFSYMFYKSNIFGNLDLGDSFSLENAVNTRSMFSSSKIRKPIDFDDKFNPKNALYLDLMFKDIQMPEGFNIGNNFHVRKNASVYAMFKSVIFNDDFWLPDCFSIDEECQDCEDMFNGAHLPHRRIIKRDRSVREIIDGLRKDDL